MALLNRLNDVRTRPPEKALPKLPKLPPLPVVDWSLVGREAPTVVPKHAVGKDDPLPKADIVVMTWTSAEWSALDHVFLNSDTTRTHSSREFEPEWMRYSRDAPETGFSPLWGYYRMVKIKNAGGKTLDVLLYKSSAHLAHPPWIKGLSDMMTHIIDDAQPDRIYSIGTAGGSSTSENLGDAAITNGGHIELKKSENDGVDWNDQTFSCTDWFPSFDLVPDVEKHLLFRLSTVISDAELNHLISKLHDENPDSKAFGYDDLINAPLQPANLTSPRGLNKKDIPLLTTDFYFIASGDDAAQYCVLEMDDTVIGRDAGLRGVNYAFVRNVSDPLVPDKTASGTPIPARVREDWSGLIYTNFGFYSSFNGALLTWATIAGASD